MDCGILIGQHKFLAPSNPKRRRGDLNTENASLLFRVGKNTQLQNSRFRSGRTLGDCKKQRFPTKTNFHGTPHMDLRV